MTVHPVSDQMQVALERISRFQGGPGRPARVDELAGRWAAIAGQHLNRTDGTSAPGTAAGRVYQAGGPHGSAASVIAASASGPDRTGPAGSWAARLPEQGKRWAGPIEMAARNAGVDPALLAALVWTESNFDPGAGSSAGARGLGQLMPGTAAGLGVDPDVPEENLDGAARYLKAQLDRFGSVELALAAYNAGPGAVSRHQGVPPYAETQAYVRRVTDRRATLTG